MAIELDPDRRLALAYVPAASRAAVEALWRLDLALASVLSTGREPLISQIRLTWWREALEKLDGGSAPAEPVLEALAQHVLPRGVTGAHLGDMEAGWTVLLSPDPLGPQDLSTYAAKRGAILFGATARLLDGEEQAGVTAGGESWALIDLARHSADAADAEAAVRAARERSAGHPARWPMRLRPLGMLAVLARRDAERALGGKWERQGAPARMLHMFRHRISGR